MFIYTYTCIFRFYIVFFFKVKLTFGTIDRANSALSSKDVVVELTRTRFMTTTTTTDISRGPLNRREKNTHWTTATGGIRRTVTGERITGVIKNNRTHMS